MDDRPEKPSGRSAALRDPLWILLAVLFLVVLGSATGLFEPFYAWVDERLRGQVGGPVGAMFADLHGGRAWAEDREGGGASFRVFLPGDTADHRTGSGQRHGAPAGVASEAAG